MQTGCNAEKNRQQILNNYFEKLSTDIKNVYFPPKCAKFNNLSIKL